MEDDKQNDVKARKLASAKQKLSAYRKAKKSKKKDANLAADGNFSDTSSEASFSVASDSTLPTSNEDSTVDSEGFHDDTLTPEIRSSIEQELTYYSRKIAELEEMLDGKEGAIMSLSEENAQLSAQLDSTRQNGVHPQNHNDTDNVKLQVTIQELSAHLQQYQAAVLQRDEAIKQLSEQVRLLQDQNQQLQTRSYTPSEDGADYASETEALRYQVTVLKEQLEQTNKTLARQAAPSPQPIVDAKNEIISLQQSLSNNELAVQQLQASLEAKDKRVNDLVAELEAKDLSIQSLGIKISKKSEELSDLSEELDLYKAKDTENVQLIAELRRGQSPDHTGSDADSIGGYSEEEMEEKQQVLRNELDEQYGQSMMAIKESMASQYEQSISKLTQDLNTAKSQIQQWEQWGQSAQVQFQQQLQQQLAALSHQLTEKHKTEVEELKQSLNREQEAKPSGMTLEQLKAQHEEEMKILTDTAEEENSNLRKRIAELEEVKDNSILSSDVESKSNEVEAMGVQIAELTSHLDSSQAQLQEFQQLYEAAQRQMNDVVAQDERKNLQLTQLTAALENAEREKLLHTTEIDRLREDNSSLSAECDDLKSKVSMQDTDLEQLRHSNQEVDTLRDKCNQLAAANDELANSLESKQVELDAVNTQMSELRDGLESSHENLVVELEDSKRINNELRIDYQTLFDSKDDLKEELNEAVEKAARVDSLEAELKQALQNCDQLKEERTSQIQEMASNELIKEEIQRLSDENSSLRGEIEQSRITTQQYQQLKVDFDQLDSQLSNTNVELEHYKKVAEDYDQVKIKLDELENQFSVASNELISYRKLESDYENLRAVYDKVMNENNILRAELEANKQVHDDLEQQSKVYEKQISEAHETIKDSEAKNQQLEQDRAATQSELEAAKSEVESLNSKLAEIDSLKDELTSLREAQAQTNQAHQEEVARYDQQIQSLSNQLANEMQSSNTSANDLTHSYQNEIDILKYQIMELQAKLEDAKQLHGDDVTADVDMAVALALREQKAKITSEYDDKLAKVKSDCASEIELEKKRAQTSFEQKFIEQMQAVRNEFEKQRQKDLQDIQQAYSKDAARQQQALYDQLEEKNRAIATLNKELSLAQEVTQRLSEETMALEDLREEKQHMQAQLDRVQGELEDIERESAPAVLTDQERLLRENPVLTDQVEDSQRYQSLQDENYQLKQLVEQLRESDYGKLRLTVEQLRQENDALRQHLTGSLIPENFESTSGVTDSSKEEIENLKRQVNELTVEKEDLSCKLRDLVAKCSSLEAENQSTIEQLQTKANAEIGLTQEVTKLTSDSESYEISNRQLTQELDAVKAERDLLLEDLKHVHEKLEETAVAYENLLSDSEKLAVKNRDLNNASVTAQVLQDELTQANQALLNSEQARQSALNELEELKTASDKVQVDVLSGLAVQNESLYTELALAKNKIQQLTPQDSPSGSPMGTEPAVEFYEPTASSSQRSSIEQTVLKLQESMNALQEQYSKETAALHAELQSERQNMDKLKEEMQASFNSSAQSVDNSNLSQLSDTLNSLQKSNEKLQNEKIELNKQLVHQEKLCEKLHDRLKASEQLSNDVHDTYLKQLAAAQSQRDEILRQLQEACRINHQVNDLVNERRSIEQEKTVLREKQKERDDLELELLKLKSQLETLTYSHHKLADTLANRDHAEMNLSKKNSILEAAVSQMEQKLKEREEALQLEREIIDSKAAEVKNVRHDQRLLENQLEVERVAHGSRLVTELESTRAECEKSSILKIRKAREDIEEQYIAAIAKLRQDLENESLKKQEKLRAQHAGEMERMSGDHRKQLEEVKQSTESRIEDLTRQLKEYQSSQISNIRQLVDETANQSDLAELRVKFEEEANQIRSDMDVTQQQKLDGVLKAHEEIVKNERNDTLTKTRDQLQKLEESVSQANRVQIEQLTDQWNTDKIQAMQTLQAHLKMEFESEKEAMELAHQTTLQDAKDVHAREMEALRDQVKVDMLQARERGLDDLKSKYEEQLSLVREQCQETIETLQYDMIEKNKKEIDDLHVKHIEQLQSARAQLAISEEMDQHYREIRDEVESLRLLRDSNSTLIEQLEKERDSLLRQANESRERLSQIHEEEMSELRMFFEAKVQETESTYMEEIDNLKQRHEVDLASARSSTPDEKLYHTGDSMTESQSAREREYIKQTNTLTVLSDLDSSEGSPPRMTLAEMNESMRSDQTLKIHGLEKEVEDLTVRIVDLENNLQVKNSQIQKLEKENEDLNMKFRQVNSEKLDLQVLYDESVEDFNSKILRLKSDQELELSQKDQLAGAHSSEMIEMEKRLREELSGEITRGKLEAASLSGKLVEASEKLAEMKESYDKQLDELHILNTKELQQLTENLKNDHENQLSKVKDDLLSNHESNLREMKEQLEQQKDAEIEEQKLQHATQVETLKQEYLEQIKQMENEYKITLDSLQSEKDKTDEDLQELKCKYDKLVSDLQSGEAELIVNLQEKHEQELSALKDQFDAKIEELSENYDQTILKLQAVSESNLKTLMDDHSNLMEKALEERKNEVNTVMEECDAKIENVKTDLVTEHDKQLADLEAKFQEDFKRLNDDSESKVAELMAKYTEELELKDRSYKQSMEKVQEMLREELMNEKQIEMDEMCEEMKVASSKALEEMLDELRTQQTDELMEQKEKYEAAIEEWKQKLEDLDFAHTEELKLLDEDHKKTVNDHKNQLNEKLDGMAQELLQLQLSHAAEIEAINSERQRRLDEALAASRDEYENLIRKEKNEHEADKDAWEAERLAHEEEVHFMEEKLTLERQEYHSKLEEKTSMIKELEKKIEDGHRKSKETSELWIANMSQLQDEQASVQEAHQKSLKDIEERYQHQIDSLQNHLQRLVSENEQKDTQIKNLKDRAIELEGQIEALNNANDFVSQLQSDYEGLRQERDAISSTNQKLLEMLSGNVECHKTLESQILRGLKHSDLDGASTPVNRPPSPPTNGAAAANAGHDDSAESEETRHEKSFDSENADEGLDMSHFSQTKEMTLFVGPHLNYSEEEQVLESTRHLQEAVELLLTKINNTSAELDEARAEQESATSQLADRNNRLAELDRELRQSIKSQQDLEEQTEQLIEEVNELRSLRSQLALANDEVEKLRQDRQRLESELDNNQEKLTELNGNYDELQQEVTTLRAEREAVHTMKEHVEQQHQALTESANESEKTLLRMNSELELEMNNLKSQYVEAVEHLQEKLHDLETRLEDVTQTSASEINQLTQQKQELELQLENLERVTANDKQFIEQQTHEREAEREEMNKLSECLTAANEKISHQEELVSTLQSQVAELQDLEHRYESRVDQSQVSSFAELESSKAELDARDKTIADMKKTMDSLEAELQNSVTRENELKLQVSELHSSQIDMTQYESLKATPENHNGITDLTDRLEDSLKALKVLKEERDDLTEQLESLRAQYDEQIQEKATLQSTVYEHMNTISQLKSQVESVKHLTSTKPLEPTRLEQLTEQLDEVKDAFERKEQEVQNLTDQLEVFRTEQLEKDSRIEQLSIQLQIQETEYAHSTEEQNANINSLQLEIEQLKTELESEKRSSQTASVDELMKELIAEKDLEIEQLKRAIKESDTLDMKAELSNMKEQLLAKTKEVDEQVVALTARSAEVDELQALLHVQKNANESLEKFNTELSRDFDELQAMLEEKDEQVSNKTASIIDLEEQTSSLVADKTNLEQEVLLLKRAVNEKQNVINEKEEEMYVLNEKLDELQSEKSEMGSLKEQVHKLLSERDSLNCMKADLEDRLQALTASFDELNQKKLALEEELRASQTTQLQSLQSDKEELSGQLDAMKLAYERITERLSVVESERDRTNNDLLVMRQEQQSLQEGLSQLIVKPQSTGQPESTKFTDDIVDEEIIPSTAPNLLTVENNSQSFDGNSLESVGEMIKRLTLIKEERDKLAAERENLLSEETAAETTEHNHISSKEMERLTAAKDELETQINGLLEEKKKMEHQVQQLQSENSQLSVTCDEIMNERDELLENLAKSHDAETVDRRLRDLQSQFEEKLQLQAEQLQIDDEEVKEDLKRQNEFYEHRVNELEETISQMKSEFEREYQKLLDDLSDKMQASLADESLNESLRRDIERRIALLAGKAHLHQSTDDGDTLRDSESVVSEGEPLQTRTKHEVGQLGKVSNDIYKYSNDVLMDQGVTESLLQEKEILQASVQSLKDLLSQIDAARAAAADGSKPVDWRATLIQAVHTIFGTERDLYLQELKTFVAARGDIHPTEAQRFETRLQSLTSRQEAAMNDLYQVDRQSLLDEIAEHRSLLQTMKEDVIKLCKQLESARAEMQRQNELNEAKLSQQQIIIEDKANSLNIEQSRNASLAEELSALKERCRSLETDLLDAETELSRKKHQLTNETQKLASSNQQLEDEQKKVSILESQLKESKDHKEKLLQDLRESETQRQVEKEETQNITLTLRQDLQQLKSQNTENARKLEEEIHEHLKSKRQLSEEQHSATDRDRKAKSQINELELSLDVERARQLETTQQLAAERCVVEELRNKLREAESRPTQDEYKQVCDTLDSEKSKSIDLQSNYEREKNRSANLSAALDLARAQALEELEREQRIIQQLKQDIDHKQRDLNDMKTRLEAEKSAVTSFKSQVNDLQSALEAQNTAFYDAQRRLTIDQMRLEQEKEAMKEKERDNQLLRRKIADNETVIAEKERIIASQHRDLVKMRSYPLQNHQDEADSPSFHSAMSNPQTPHKVSQAKSIYKRLRSLALRLQDASENTQTELADVFSELHDIRSVIDEGNDASMLASYHDSSSRLLDLVEKLSREKAELRSVLSHLEEEIQMYKLKEAGRSPVKGFPGQLSKYWTDVVNELYSRMRKAESRVRGLIYQKKLILLQLGGYQECEAEVLQRLANMGAFCPAGPSKVPPKRRFKAAVKAIITIKRMRWLVTRSKKICRDGVQSLLNNDKENKGQSSVLLREDGEHQLKRINLVCVDDNDNENSLHTAGSHAHKHHSHRPKSHSSGPVKNTTRHSSVKDSKSLGSDINKKYQGRSENGVALTYQPSENNSLRNQAPLQSQSANSRPNSGKTSLTAYIEPTAQENANLGKLSLNGLGNITDVCDGPSYHQSSGAGSRPRSRQSTSSRPSSRANARDGAGSRQSTPISTPRSPPPTPDGLSGRLSPTYTNGSDSKMLSQSSPPSHAQVHDDSVVENIQRLERIQERLTQMNKPAISDESV